jgi:hypothetical protein
MRFVRTGRRDNPTGYFTEKGTGRNAHASASASYVLTCASYVQMLERQQLQMIAGIQELYRRLRNNEAWPCFVAEDDLGPQPLTHKVLETLGILPGPWDETDYVRDALTTAPQSPFDVGFPNSLPQLPEFSPSYGADDGSTSTPECSPSSRANNGSTSAPKFSPSYGANDGWMPTPEYTLDYGANDGWMLTPESDIVCTESLQLAHMDHILPTTDDSRPLSKRRKVDLSMQLTPPFTSFLTFSHPSNIPFNTGVM